MWGNPELREEPITCSIVKKPDVYIEPIARSKISLLMGEYPHQEWLAYMVGQESDAGNIFIRDIVVPPHKEASSASAEAEPFNIPEDCMGVIHSHHGMGAFHSGTDQSYVDKNFLVSITAARANGSGVTYDAVGYRKTPCGKGMTLKLEVKYFQPQPDFDKEQFLKEAKGNIEKARKYLGGADERIKQGMAHARYHTPAFAPKGLPYSGFTDVYTDGQGNVMTKKELDELTKQIWGD